MPINNITQTISELPAAGRRGVDVQTIFVTKQEDFQDHLQGTTVVELNALVEQQNTMAVEMNSTATQVNTNANTATTKAGEASTSASNASTSANTATTRAGVATNKANEATASAVKAGKWSDEAYNVEVEIGRYSAKHWSTVAENAVGDTVKLTGNQTIAGVKTFTSSPIMPTPTTDFQSVPLRSTNITVNVGAGQTYTTINQALEYLSGFYPKYKQSGVTATVNLKAGFVMAEQVLVSGIDLGWITIVGEGVETLITHTALTTNFNGGYPAFGVDKGGTSPVIGQLFRFNVEKVGGVKHGLMVYGAGSGADVLPGKGFIGAGTFGIYATDGSIINASGANCSNAGTFGIYATDGSIINASGANCSNAGTFGIYATDGSIITADGANCSGAGSVGIYAITASTITADGANCSGAGSVGIAADRGSIINASGANCSNARNTGIVSDRGSIINASGAIVQNQTTGTSMFRTTDGSNIVARGINTTGGTVPVFSQAVNTLTAHGIIYG